jgi:hypothetical protein
MGIFPKYRVGDFCLTYHWNPSIQKNEENLFQIKERYILREGLSFEWAYHGWYCVVTSNDPFQIKYSTTGSIAERELLPLEARLFDRDWRFPSKEKLKRMNPQYESLDSYLMLTRKSF